MKGSDRESGRGFAGARTPHSCSLTTLVTWRHGKLHWESHPMCNLNLPSCRRSRRYAEPNRSSLPGGDGTHARLARKAPKRKVLPGLLNAQLAVPKESGPIGENVER
mmetsp:Transcript_153535/g.372826  ORF Transcript_153535/g.372826 Transcript_153535/m.372826 type:complete len:107 (+) Transcript_153535:656-976(+)